MKTVQTLTECARHHLTMYRITISLPGGKSAALARAYLANFRLATYERRCLRRFGHLPDGTR